MEPGATAGTSAESGPLGGYELPVIGGASLLGAAILAAVAVFLLRGRAQPAAPPPLPPPPLAAVTAPPATLRAPLSVQDDVPPTVPGAMPRLSLPPGPLSRPPGQIRGQVHRVTPAAVEAELEAFEERGDLLGRLRSALGRSRELIRGRIDGWFRAGRIDAAALEGLEEALIRADVGVSTAERLLGRLRAVVGGGTATAGDLRAALRSEMVAVLGPTARLQAPRDRPWDILVVGVNGSGKTTTVGKLAARLRGEGRSVVLAAADTFRAAATDQLGIWAERAGAHIVAGQDNADPASVVFDALAAAKARNADVVLVDTAGRLQTARPLMEQLSKIRRIIDRAVPGAPHDTLLVLDGTMGQNALSQARLFHEATPITGVVVTKLDGTAKGGVVLAIAAELGLPVKLIGIGERVEDLRDFEAEPFVDALT
jgi:fused signal recognition particle receptor